MAEVAYMDVFEEIDQIRRLISGAEDPLVQRNGDVLVWGRSRLDHVRNSLRGNESLSRKQTEDLQLVSWAATPDLTRIIYISPAYEDIWGRSCESLHDDPQSWITAIHPDDQERVKAATSRGANGHSFDEEYRIVRPDGSVCWIHDKGCAVRTLDGAISQIAGVAKDITERKRAEEKLAVAYAELQQKADEQSEQLLLANENWRSLLEHAPDYIMIVDREGLIQFINRMAPTLTMDDVLGKSTIYDHSDPAHHIRITEALDAAFDRGDSVEYEVYCPEIDMWFANRVGPIRRDDKIVSAIVVAHDVTERKKDEQKLRDSEARFRGYFELGLVGIAITSPEKGFIEFNDQFCEIFGYSKSELTQKTWPEITHPDDLAVGVEHFNRVLAGETDGYSLDKRFIRKDGSVIYGSIDVKCVRRTDGAVNYFVAMVQDITDRKQAGEALLQNEERYRTLAENSQDYIMRYDRDYRHTYANDAALRITGRTAAEFVGKTHREMGFPAHLCQLWEDAIDRVFANNQPHREVFDWTSSEGTATYDWRVLPELNGDGEVMSVLGVSRDITQLKQAVDDLKASEEKSRLLLNSTGDAIYGLDLEGNCTFCNPACLRLLGFEDESQLLGRNMHDLIHHTRPDGSPYPEEQCQVFLAFREGEGTHIDNEVLWRADGTSFAAEYRSFPVVREGKTVGAAVSFVDISDRKRAEGELRSLQDDLAHVARLSTMGEMATGIAHELNQPLTAIATYSHIVKHMLDRPTTERQEFKDTLDKLEGQAIRAGEIVWRLRNFTKKSLSNHVRTDLNAIVRDVGRLVEPDIRQAEVFLQMCLEETCPAVSADAIQIQQVLVNLIRNAIDAMQTTSTVRREITISTQLLQDGLVGVTVSDVGKGLNPDELDQVFEAFFSTKQAGMGMGLAISRSIIESHHGELWAEPNAGPGVTFGFSLPLADDQSL